MAARWDGSAASRSAVRMATGVARTSVVAVVGALGHEPDAAHHERGGGARTDEADLVADLGPEGVRRAGCQRHIRRRGGHGALRQDDGGGRRHRGERVHRDVDRARLDHALPAVVDGEDVGVGGEHRQHLVGRDEVLPVEAEEGLQLRHLPEPLGMACGVVDAAPPATSTGTATSPAATTKTSRWRPGAGSKVFADARRAGTITLDGPPSLTRAFGGWFLWSPFAPTVRAVLAGRSHSG